MNKKTRALIGGAGVSAAVAAVALTGGTSAFFYDVETIGGNSIGSCSLSIDPVTTVTTAGYDNEEGAADQMVVGDTSANVVKVSNMQPGDAFTADITLTNTGTCNGDMWADINYPLDFAKDSAFAQALKANVKINDSELGTYDFGDLSYAFPYMVASNVEDGTATTITVTVTWPQGTRGEESVAELEDQTLKFTVDYAIVQNGIDPTGARGLSEPLS